MINDKGKTRIIIFEGKTNDKGRSMINVLGVFTGGMVFLAIHDYTVLQDGC